MEEGYLFHGLFSKEPRYGRLYMIYEESDHIQLGFFSFEHIRLNSQLYGKGIVYDLNTKEQKEGLFLYGNFAEN